MNINEFHAKLNVLVDQMVAEWRTKHADKPDHWPLELSEFRWYAEMVSYMGKYFNID